MPKLAASVENLESIPEAQREFYTKVDDRYVLDADIENHPTVNGLRGAYKADHQKVKDLETVSAKFKDVDLDKWNALKGLTEEDIAAIQQAKEGKKPPQNREGLDLEVEISKRIEPMKTSHQRELERREAMLKKEQDEKQKLVDDIKRIRIQTALTAACAAEGVLPSAVEEVVEWSQKYFKIDDNGQVIATDPNGVEVFGVDGKPMRPQEWLATRGTEKRHWFPLNAGGGANGGRYGGENKAMRRSELKDLKAKVDFIKKYGREAFEALPA